MAPDNQGHENQNLIAADALEAPDANDRVLDGEAATRDLAAWTFDEMSRFEKDCRWNARKRFLWARRAEPIEVLADVKRKMPYRRLAGRGDAIGRRLNVAVTKQINKDLADMRHWLCKATLALMLRWLSTPDGVGFAADNPQPDNDPGINLEITWHPRNKHRPPANVDGLYLKS